MHFILTPILSFYSVKYISNYQHQLNKQNYVAAGSLPRRLAIYLGESNKSKREQESFPLSFRFRPRLDCRVDKLSGVSLSLTHNTNTYTHSKNKVWFRSKSVFLRYFYSYFFDFWAQLLFGKELIGPNSFRLIAPFWALQLFSFLSVKLQNLHNLLCLISLR